jgi:Cu+-exporting ATPase
MHREISHTDQAFQRESNLSLYALTALIGVLIGLDLWPIVAAWIDPAQSWLPTWRNEINGYRLYALCAAVLGGARALYGSLERLSEGKVGADLAIAIAVIAAILTREALVAAEIVFVGLVGECLESITFERSQRAIHRIVEICPRRCWLLRDGQEVRVLTSELQVGDRVVVKPGGRVPVDGVVVDGRSAVDTSALTGESLPVDKGPSDEVLAGSLNQFGALTIEARSVAEQTVVGRVAEMTARALKDKAPLERTADRLARYFLPIVLGLAALTFAVGLAANWPALIRAGGEERMETLRTAVRPALAVLVVACPCALILATPAAILAALGRLAGTGILIKGGSALERLANVQAIAFDKTGTLTEGRLELGDVLGLNSVAADEVLLVAAIAEERSEHPIARLIVQESAARGLARQEPVEFQAHPGAGVLAEAGAARILVGNRRLLEENGISISPDSATLLAHFDATGQTVLLVARDGVILGGIGVRDRVRSEAAAVLSELRALGIDDIALLTGDRAAAALPLAAALKISEVHSELLPEQKAAFLQQWRRERGKPAAMVGDGINDAPALAGADVGVAIAASGADIAAEAGDIVVMGEPLRPLPLLVRLSRETVRIIRQNILVFAFGVNLVGIVVTAWLWPILAPASWQGSAPLAAVIYHQIGSVAVLLNAMRLLWFERDGSPTRQAVQFRMQRIDMWIEHHLDVGEVLHWLSHHWQAALGVVGGLLLIAYGLTGLTTVGPDEVAVVRRFGRPLDGDLEPGLHWRWPWPIEDITRIQPDRVHLIEVGFRSTPGRSAGPSPQGWSSPHAGEGIVRFPEEAVMMTGDGNLVELLATVRYTVRDPRTYLFAVNNPDALVRSAAESALREIVAALPFQELLTSGRARVQREAVARLTSRCHDGGSGDLGIHLEGLSIHDLHPPQEVVNAYHGVTKAMEHREEQVNKAKADAIRKERDAQAGREEIIRQAKAAACEQVTLAEALRDAFVTRRHARVSLSQEEECRLLNDAFRWMEAGADSDDVWREYQENRNAVIARQTAVADFRLFWEALGAALKDREKILIDADKVPGQRQLLLFDPKDLSLPLLGTPSAAPKGEGH